MLTHKKIQFKKYACILTVGRYVNGRIALQLVDEMDLNPIAIATVNLPDKRLGANKVFIKNWSENEGILDALADAGVIEPTGKKVDTGFVQADIAELAISPDELIEASDEEIKTVAKFLETLDDGQTAEFIRLLEMNAGEPYVFSLFLRQIARQINTDNPPVFINPKK